MNYIKEPDLKDIILAALREDIGARDVTSDVLIPKNKNARAAILAKEDLVVCGLGVAAFTFRLQNKMIKFKALAKDGDYIRRGGVIAKVEGRARPILSAERVALNFLSLLSGIATTTREYVEAVSPYKVKILDTRKTIPGLRMLEKYAVRIGGGYNHRFSLDEMVLIKDNHIKVLGDRLWVLGFEKIREKISQKVMMEVEVRTLKEFRKALKLRPDIIMLDNMSIKDIIRAVKIRNSLISNTQHPIPKLEASGGIALKNIRQISATGVDMISIGALTHSIKSVDLSLEVL